MTRKCVPMIHVPDVQATAAWYETIGFRTVQTAGGEDGGLSFARLVYGDSEVMFNIGGVPSSARRREVDLYVYAEDVDGLHATLEDRVDVVEGPHDTFYGMRELIVRDLNRFWITFGEPSAAARLLGGIAEGDLAAVQVAVTKPGVSADLLTVGLMKASHASQPNEAIVRVLGDAGAAEPKIAPDQLRQHEGTYAREGGGHVRVLVRDGLLRTFTDDGFGAHLVPIDETSFRPLEFGTTTVTFGREGTAATMTFSHGAHQERHTRVQDAGQG
ncbi:MAG TPA: VOC family protein [Vicinamibacterales bacterium]|nr:VOC family protein [Vicinamibacterales bacterium]